jgi:hypothetical protein
MTESIPVSLIQGWIEELKAALSADTSEGKIDRKQDHDMRFALHLIQDKIKTWLRHKENVENLNRSGKQFLITKNVNLSDGLLKRLEWYEGNQFITLAWRHGMHEEIG